MISVPNPQLLLSGNKFFSGISLLVLLLMACGVSSRQSYLQNQKPQQVQSADSVIEPRLRSEDKRKQEKDMLEQKYPEVLKNDFRVVLLLPFMNHISPEPKSLEFQIKASVADYYQGILLALDSLQKEGIRLDLHVLDTRKDSVYTRNLLQKSEVALADLIIGPLDAPSFALVSDFAKDKNIPLVAPFTVAENMPIEGGLNFFCNPSLGAYGQSFATYVREENPNARIWYIGDGTKTDQALLNGLEAGFNGSSQKVQKITLAEASGKITPSDSVKQYVLIGTDAEAFANNVLKTLNKLPEGTNLNVVGLDTWMSFKNPEFNHWNRLGLIILSNYFADNNSAAFANFYQSYRNRFQLIPTELSLRGFDQMMFFGHALMAFGKEFPFQVKNTFFDLTHNSYYWQATGKGLVNKHINVLLFSDYRLIRLY